MLLSVRILKSYLLTQNEDHVNEKLKFKVVQMFDGKQQKLVLYRKNNKAITISKTHVKDTKNVYVILCFYINGILIVGSNDKMIKFIKDMLNLKFYIKDTGLSYVILGIKI